MDLVIPTLGICDAFFDRFLPAYLTYDSITKVIVVDNSQESIKRNFEKHPKLKIHKPSSNIYVNPSWNLGVKASTSEHLALVNDDIYATEDALESAKELIRCGTYDLISAKTHNILEGLSSPAIIRNKTLAHQPIVLKKHLPLGIQLYSAGSLIVLERRSYKEIPKGLKVFFGDDYLFRNSRKPGVMASSYIKGYLGQSCLHLGEDERFIQVTQDDWVFAYKSIIAPSLGMKNKNFMVYNGSSSSKGHNGTVFFKNTFGENLSLVGIRLTTNEADVFLESPQMLLPRRVNYSLGDIVAKHIYRNDPPDPLELSRLFINSVKWIMDSRPCTSQATTSRL